MPQTRPLQCLTRRTAYLDRGLVVYPTSPVFPHHRLKLNAGCGHMWGQATSGVGYHVVADEVCHGHQVSKQSSHIKQSTQVPIWSRFAAMCFRSSLCKFPPHQVRDYRCTCRQRRHILFTPSGTNGVLAHLHAIRHPCDHLSQSQYPFTLGRCPPSRGRTSSFALVMVPSAPWSSSSFMAIA